MHHLASDADVTNMLSVLGGARVVLRDRDEVAALDGDPIMTGPSHPSDLAVVLFTSGSTGSPKAVLHTQRALEYKAHLMARVHGLHNRDCVLMPAPLAHISGLLNAVLVPGATQMRIVLMAKWDPDRALALIEEHRVSFMIGPPTFFVGLMNATGFTPERVASIRLISSGGAGVSPAFVAEATDRFQCVVKRTYGSTEAPTVTTSFAGDPPDRARETDGRPVGDVELKLADDGELLLRGPELFVGYARDDQTRAALDRGWFRTGDLARIDDDGWLTITGRIKDIVIRGGENIAVAEVEAVLEAHPAVRQAVVVGEPDDRLGERVAAFVVTGTSFDLDDCRAWFAAQGVARYKTPERVVPIATMPTLAAGKPDRAALRAMLTDRA
jgi:acyl-CoA synthetase (AMP-forming)/AMP-acid ligase II